MKLNLTFRRQQHEWHHPGGGRLGRILWRETFVLPRWSHSALELHSRALEELRKAHGLTLREMAATICELHDDACRFLMENRWGADFGRRMSHNLCFVFRCSISTWLYVQLWPWWCNDLPLVPKEVAKPCPGHHEHEECPRGNAKASRELWCVAYLLNDIKVAMDASSSMSNPTASGQHP